MKAVINSLRINDRRGRSRSTRLSLIAGPYRIAAKQWGDPSAETVVLVHGLIVSSEYMSRLGRELGQDHRVLAPDLPGFGRTSKPANVLDTAELGAALADWIIAADLDQATLVGHSYGSQTATACLAALAERDQRQRVAHIVLIGPTADRRARTRWQHIARWLQCFPLEPISMIPLELIDLARCGPRRAWKTFNNMMTDDPMSRLPNLGVPALVMRGRYDAIAPHAWASEVARQAHSHQLITISRGGHSINMAKARVVGDNIRAFENENRTASTARP